MKTKQIVCAGCTKLAIVSLATARRHMKKYGKVLCRVCTRDIISQSSKQCWCNSTYRCSALKGLRSRTRISLAAAARKAWQNHRDKFLMAKAGQATKMRIKWADDEFRRKYALTTEQFIKIAQTVHNSRYNYDKTVYVAADQKVCITCPAHGDFWQEPRDHTSHHHGCPYCYSPISSGHKEIIDLLTSHDIIAIPNDRTILAPLELDIWIPQYQLGIEYNGVYWHSGGRVGDRLYHSKKADKAEIAKIRLLQVWESEWQSKRAIVTSMIKHRLLLNTRLYARKLSIREIDEQDATTFFNTNHLMGHRCSGHYFSLVCSDGIMASVAISRHPHGSELIRYATTTNMAVAGGLSRLLQHAINSLHIERLTSYADRRYATSNAYLKCGFALLSITKPGYCYTKNGAIYSRQMFQKHKLASRLTNFNPALSETENMFNNGYRRIWDAGHYKLLWNTRLIY